MKRVWCGRSSATSEGWGSLTLTIVSAPAKTASASAAISVHKIQSLNSTAFMAAVHCLTGGTIGEVLGMVIGTASGWSNWPTVALAEGLAFVFGYAMTLWPLRRPAWRGALLLD